MPGGPSTGQRAAAKERLDNLLVSRGLAPSRARAQALVMAGLVFSGERKLEKSGLRLGPDTPLDVRGPAHPWVSRGGVKLAHGLEYFDIAVEGAKAG